MRKLGFLVALIGIGLCIVPLTGYQHEMIDWINTWGVKKGWIVRGGTIIFGLMIVLIAPLPDE